MKIETRWYRAPKALDIKCVECGNTFTPNRELAFFHADCYMKILDMEKIIGETRDEGKEIKTYIQETELGYACCLCNEIVEANKEFVIIHYSCNLKHIELMEKAQKMEAEKNIEEKPDDKNGRE